MWPDNLVRDTDPSPFCCYHWGYGCPMHPYEKGISMAEIKKKEICKCTNCGNEAEMIVTCSLEDEPMPAETSPADPEKAAEPKKVKGTATCSHCGNEADMWVDI